MPMTTVDLRQQRALTVLRDGSPNFFMNMGAIAAGASQYVLVEDQFPKARKYQPMMNITITNNDTTNVASGEISVNLSSPPMSQSEYTRYRTLYS